MRIRFEIQHLKTLQYASTTVCYQNMDSVFRFQLYNFHIDLHFERTGHLHIAQTLEVPRCCKLRESVDITGI